MHFYQWGDPHMDQPQNLKIGDKAQVKSFVPFHSGRIGKVIDLEYGCTLEFSDGSTCVYDEDDLIKVEE